MQYIDMHCHMIPFVDDGCQNLEEARAMLTYAYSEGTRHMIVTPHYIKGNTKIVSGAALQEQYERYIQLRDEICPNMGLSLGNELFGIEGIERELKGQEEHAEDIYANTMAKSRYVLVEFGIDMNYSRMLKILRSLVMKGYYPIVAHMERYECLWKEEDKIQELIQNGCYLQMNCNSVIGGLFDQNARYCRKLVAEGYIHFMASDAHNMNQRKPGMKKAYEALQKNCDKNQLQRLFYGNAEMILNHKCI